MKDILFVFMCWMLVVKGLEINSQSFKAGEMAPFTSNENNQLIKSILDGVEDNLTTSTTTTYKSTFLPDYEYIDFSDLRSSTNDYENIQVCNCIL